MIDSALCMNTLHKVKELVDRISRLPTLPANIERLNNMMDHEHVTMDAIGEEIARDQSLSAQVLKLINSSFYGFSGRISSVSHAVILLGVNAVRNVISTAWASTIIADSFPGLYEHSLACSRTCFIVSTNLTVADPTTMSSIGLLHDIGKMVLAEYLADEFNAVKSQVETTDSRFCDAEKETIGVTHADIGDWLLKKWNLPESSRIPIGLHHDFDASSEYASSAAVLILADAIVRAEGFGWPGDNRMPALNHDAMQILDLKPGDLKALMDECADQSRDIPKYGTASLKCANIQN